MGRVTFTESWIHTLRCSHLICVKWLVNLNAHPFKVYIPMTIYNLNIWSDFHNSVFKSMRVVALRLFLVLLISLLVAWTVGKSAASASLLMIPRCVMLSERTYWRERTPSADLDRLGRWACVNLMSFNKAECKVLYVGQGNPSHRYRRSGEWIENTAGEKELRCWWSRSSTWLSTVYLQPRKPNIS